MEVLILAGGLGTRLKHLLNNKPKALADINGKPFLYYLISYLIKNGADRFIFSLGYLNEQIIEYIEQNWNYLSYKTIIEEKPLGTGGAIKKAIALSSENDILIVNADTYFNMNLNAFSKFHMTKESDCTIAVKEMYDFDRYGAVELDQNSRIIAFQEKKFVKRGFINAGFIYLKKSCFIKMDLPEVFSFEKEFLETNLETLNFFGFISNNYFIDIGIPIDFERAQTELEPFL